MFVCVFVSVIISQSSVRESVHSPSIHAARDLCAGGGAGLQITSGQSVGRGFVGREKAAEVVPTNERLSSAQHTAHSAQAASRQQPQMDKCN